MPPSKLSPADTSAAPGITGTSELPDPFVFDNGLPVTTPAHWALRRDELTRHLVPLAYGDFPPTPGQTRCVVLHTAVVQRLRGARLLSCRVTADGTHAFLLRVFVPPGDGRRNAGKTAYPVVLHGDGCWHYASDEVIAAVLSRGYIFAQFNRLEVAPDTEGAAQQHEQARLFGTRVYAALACWAWAYQRAVDALAQLNFADAARVAVVGHSRGGKAALLAAATDVRIALASANNSGAGGAGCFRWQGPGAESLGAITTAFPQWFGPGLAGYAGREQALPFDQHFLKALVAPRALLTTEALDDAWANPQGSWQTQRAAAEVYTFLGVEGCIATRYRAGGHDHAPEDWWALLDFCDAQWGDQAQPRAAQADPFPGLPPAHRWRRPSA